MLRYEAANMNRCTLPSTIFHKIAFQLVLFVLQQSSLLQSLHSSLSPLTSHLHTTNTMRIPSRMGIAIQTSTILLFTFTLTSSASQFPIPTPSPSQPSLLNPRDSSSGEIVFGACVPPNGNFQIAPAGATCNLMADAYGITFDEFLLMNPQLHSNCDNLQAGSRYCVGAAEQKAKHSSTSAPPPPPPSSTPPPPPAPATTPPPKLVSSFSLPSPESPLLPLFPFHSHPYPLPIIPNLPLPPHPHKKPFLPPFRTH